jgi:ABC-type transport system involved in multi-copper enzyme maturation permease subunit
MSHVLVIAAREIRERKLVIIGAVLIAPLSALAPLISGAHSSQRGDILIVAGAVTAVLYAAGLAIAIGGGIVGRDLRTGRMSFYFSKPVSASAIWFGKVIGALTTIAVAAIIILIPALAMGGRAWEMRLDQPLRLLALVAGGAILLFLVSHVVSTLIASRSPLVLADLAMFLTLLGVLLIVTRPLAIAGATYSVTFIVLGVLAASVLVILAAGARQLARGRTDARRNHIELSRVVWPVMLLVVLGAAGYSKWVRTLTPRNINLWGIAQSPAGDWLVLEGVRHYTDYHGAVLMNMTTGATKQVAAHEVIFSRDGRTTAWLQPDGATQYRVTTMDLSRSTELRDTGIVVFDSGPMVLSDDGQQLAVVNRDVLSVYEIESGKLLGSVRMAKLSVRVQELRMFFTKDGGVQLYYVVRSGGDDAVVHAARFVPASRRLSVTGTYVTDATNISLRTDSAGQRVLLREGWGDNRHARKVLDGVTLAPTLPGLPAGPSIFTAMFLADGSMAFVDKAGERSLLKVVSASGQPLTEFPLVDSGTALLAGEVGKGRLLLSISRGPLEKRTYSAQVINVSTGVIERREQNVRPNLFSHGFQTDPRPFVLSASSPSVLIDGKQGDWRQLWRWNPLTGEKTPLVN